MRCSGLGFCRGGLQGEGARAVAIEDWQLETGNLGARVFCGPHPWAALGASGGPGLGVWLWGRWELWEEWEEWGSKQAWRLCGHRWQQVSLVRQVIEAVCCGTASGGGSGARAGRLVGGSRFPSG